MLIKGNHLSLDTIERMLVMQLGDIGDVVLTTPALKALKETCPGIKIMLLLREHAEGLMRGCPWVDGVVSLRRPRKRWGEELAYQKELLSRLRKEKFDLTVDLRTGTRGAILSFMSGARWRIGRFADDGPVWRNSLFTHLVKPQNELYEYSTLHNFNILAPFQLLRLEDPTPKLVLTAGINRRAAHILRSEGIPDNRPIIALHPFSRWSYKEWPIDNYGALIDYIRSRKKCSIIITGSSGDVERFAELDLDNKGDVYCLTGKTSLDELAGILRKCDLLIGIDSAPIHIAAAVGTPTVTIFGPSSPTCWAPRGEHHDIIFKDLPCIPCRQKGCNNSESSRCLKELTLAEILPIIDRRLA